MGYPVEFLDLQSPFKYYNEPTNLTVETGYDGYESRVVPIESDEIYCPLKIPTLDAAEDELTCIEMPTDKNVDEMALISNYVEERSKRDQYYKGIFITGDLERVDTCGPPSNQVEKYLNQNGRKLTCNGKIP